MLRLIYIVNLPVRNDKQTNGKKTERCKTKNDTIRQPSK